MFKSLPAWILQTNHQKASCNTRICAYQLYSQLQLAYSTLFESGRYRASDQSEEDDKWLVYHNFVVLQ